MMQEETEGWEVGNEAVPEWLQPMDWPANNYRDFTLPVFLILWRKKFKTKNSVSASLGQICKALYYTR